jgi:ribosomal protein S18 acetylase RimI-like enzyme
MEMPYSDNACFKDIKRFVVVDFPITLFRNNIDPTPINDKLYTLQVRRLLIQNFTGHAKVHNDIEPITEEVVNASLVDPSIDNNDAMVYTILDRKRGKLVACLFIRSIRQNVEYQRLMEFEAQKAFYIYNVCTDKAYQRIGCCKRLFDHVTNKTGYGRFPMFLDVSVAYGKVPNQKGFNPAAYCYEKYGFRFASAAPVKKDSDGYIKTMVRPSFGRYSFTLLNNTKSAYKEQNGGDEEDPRVRRFNIQGKIIELLVLEDNTKNIPPGTAGSSLTGLYINPNTGYSYIDTLNFQ